MSRITDDELQRLKRDVPVAALCRDYGIELKQTGPDTLMACCPFHDDAEPSFGVTPSKNLWNCLAGCGGGDNIQLVMKKEGVSFRHAVERLRERMGASPAAAVLTTRQGTERAVLVEAATNDAAVLESVVEFYHQQFCGSSQAMAYLQRRKAFHPEAATKFKLGFANRTLGYRVPATTADGKKLKAQLMRLGIMRESGHEHLNGCVLMPIIHDGRVTEIYGRRLTRPTRQAGDHIYLPGPHVGVWNADEIKLDREWIICEAGIDALSFWTHGFHNVTWSYGVNGFTPDHWQLVRHVRPERVIIAYDNDEAGNRAANELAQRLEPEGVAVWRAEPPPHRDINDVVRDAQEPHAALSSMLASARRLLPPTGSVFALAAAPTAPIAPTPPPAAEEAAKEEASAPPAPATSPTATAAPSPTPAATPPPPAADPAPAAPAFSVVDEGREAHYIAGERQWRVRGLDANSSFEHLKANVRFAYRGKFHLDTLDLYAARARAAFIAQADQLTGAGKEIIEGDLMALLEGLEVHQQKQITAKMKPVDSGPVMSPEEEAEALRLLKEPALFERILADYATAGTVGEDANKLLGYLIAVSRKLSDPLSGLIVSRSAAGKSALMNAILDFVPEEDKQVVTAMTTQALYYLPDDGLRHKVLAVVEDEGSGSASYPLKILQSEKKLILAVTVKDGDGGMPKTELKTVEGPVAQLMTSTQAEFDEELANRFLVLSVDEEREQTRRIHAAQREAETLRGWLRGIERENVLRCHHNAQRLLRPLRVNNPLVDRLSFPDDQLRLRRDHKKYLGLIRVIAFLRQYQKPIRSCEHLGKTLQFIEVDENDLRLANQVAAQALGRSLDELAPPTRAFLMALHGLVETWAKERSLRKEAVRFTRREVREKMRWSEPQVRRHLDRLTELEYLACHRVPGTASRYHYELIYDGEGNQGERFLMGMPHQTAPEGGKSSSPEGKSS